MAEALRKAPDTSIYAGGGNDASQRPPASLDLATLGKRFDAAIAPMQAYTISLHDARGGILWLSDSSMGPDAHRVAEQAAQAFEQAESAPLVVVDLDDMENAVLIRATNEQGVCVGIVMLTLASRAIDARGNGLAQLITPEFRQALAQFSSERCVRTALPVMTAPDQTSYVSADTPIQKLTAALRRSPLTLYVQRIVPITPGNSHQCYEVLLRSETPGAPNTAPTRMLKAAAENGLGALIDRRVVRRLCRWLKDHRAVWANQNTLWTVNLAASTLTDSAFVDFVASRLTEASVPAGVVGFELDATTAVSVGQPLFGAAVALHRIGCPLILDNFTSSAEGIDLLHLPGVKLLKITLGLTAPMRAIKDSQGAIRSICQMAKSLNIQTAAKHAQSAQDQQWLAALGVDFVQSNAFAPAVPLDSLASWSASVSPL